MAQNKNTPAKKASASRTGYVMWLPFVLAFIVFGNTIINDYNLDDELVTKKHPLTSKGIAAIPDIIASPYFQNNNTAYEYRPIVLISFAIEHTLFGESPHTSHFINVLIYAFTMLLLFRVLRSLLGAYGLWLPLAVTLLFTVHPLHTEAVAGIKNRDELLALFFAILAWHFTLTYTLQNKKTYVLWTALTFALAVLSKTSALPFAFIIPVSVIIFYPENSKRIFLPLLMYALTAGFIAPFYNFAHKVFFAFLVFLAPYATGFILTYAHQVKTLPSRIKEFLWHTAGDADSGIQMSALYIWLTLFAALVLCLTGIFYNFRVLILIPSLALIVLYFISKAHDKPYFFTTFILLISLVSLNYTQSHIVAFCLVLILFVYFFESKKPVPYLIISLALLLAPWLWWAKAEGLFWILYLAFIMWLMSHQAKRRWGIALIIIFFISSPLQSYFRGMSLFNSGFLYSVAAMGAALLLHLRFGRYRLALLILFAVIPLALAVKFSTMTGSYSVIVKEYFNPATAINIGADVLPAAGRPLDLVEMPLAPDAPLQIKIGTALYVTGGYLEKLVFPLNMGFYYGYRHVEPQQWTHPQAIASLTLHLLLFVFSVLMYKRNRLFLFGFLFWIAAISLFSNLVMPLPGLMADRFAYIPSLGFCLFVASALFYIFRIRTAEEAPKAFKNKYLVGVIILVVLLWSGRSIVRNADWKNHLTLFRHDIAYLDASAQAHNLLASNLMIYAAEEKNNQKAVLMKQEAASHYKKALDIYPGFFNASYDLGRNLYEQKQFDSALVYFRMASALNPEFFDPYLQMAFIYHQTDSLLPAIEYYEKALALKPAIPAAYRNLSGIYAFQGETDKLAGINRRFMPYAPNPKEPFINIARAFYLNKQADSAAFYFEEILKIDPRDTDAIKALAEIFINTGQGEKADFYLNRLNSLQK